MRKIWIFVAWIALTGGAVAQEKIVDNGDVGFSQEGFVSAVDADSHQGDVVIASRPTIKDSVRYSPGLTGVYDVYLYWKNYADMDTDVLWTSHHVNGVTTQAFSQRNNPGWHFHGTYQLDDKSHVSLDVRKLQDAEIVADAVKFMPAAKRVVKRIAKDTITPMALNHGDELHFQLRNGETQKIKLVGTAAEAVIRDKSGRVNQYKFSADLLIDGKHHVLERVIPVQESFYEPLVVDGMRIWLDAVSDIFIDDSGFMEEKDILLGIACRPKRKARIVVNDETDRICPDQLAWWYPEKKDHIDVRDCYQGQDVWMGPFGGKRAHGGLDINMKSGTLLYTPIGFDDHYLFDSLKKGDNNNRWRGVRKWDNGAVWWLQAHHLNKMLLPERSTLRRGMKYAETAGVAIGAKEHSHFVFRVIEEGESYWIDPWIFFWQTFRDNLNEN